MEMELEKKNKKNKEKGSSLFKEFLAELSGNIVFEIIWNIIMFIPRVIIRLISHIF